MLTKVLGYLQLYISQLYSLITLYMLIRGPLINNQSVPIRSLEQMGIPTQKDTLRFEK